MCRRGLHCCAHLLYAAASHLVDPPLHPPPAAAYVEEPAPAIVLARGAHVVAKHAQEQPALPRRISMLRVDELVRRHRRRELLTRRRRELRAAAASPDRADRLAIGEA